MTRDCMSTAKYSRISSSGCTTRQAAADHDLAGVEPAQDCLDQRQFGEKPAHFARVGMGYSVEVEKHNAVCTSIPHYCSG